MKLFYFVFALSMNSGGCCLTRFTLEFTASSQKNELDGLFLHGENEIVVPTLNLRTVNMARIYECYLNIKPCIILTVN